VKLVPGIVSAGPPPRALAGPAHATVASRTAVNIFHIAFSWVVRWRVGFGNMTLITTTKLAALVRLVPIVATVAVVWLASPPGPACAAPEIGEAAPALIVNALDGTTFDLTKMRGKVVLVNYWATWCAPCRREMPKLDTFYKRYHAQGLEIIGISIDFKRDFEKVRKVAQAVTYPTAVAKAITDDGFGIPKGVPITWIIDVDGKVRDRFIDVRDELLNEIVVPLLPH
jgi:cytochrome c biogenesis protein CcmG/thiol:disulfide interchange protein DsbE